MILYTFCNTRNHDGSPPLVYSFIGTSWSFEPKVQSRSYPTYIFHPSSLQEFRMNKTNLLSVKTAAAEKE